MDRDWVVDDRCDAGVLKLLFQPVAAAGFREAKVGAVCGWSAAGAASGRGAASGHAHDELVPAVARGSGLGQGEAFAACEFGAVALGDGGALLHPAAQVGQLDAQNGGLDRIEAAVVTELAVEVAAGHAMHRQLPHPLR